MSDQINALIEASKTPADASPIVGLRLSVTQEDIDLKIESGPDCWFCKHTSSLHEDYIPRRCMVVWCPCEAYEARTDAQQAALEKIAQEREGK